MYFLGAGDDFRHKLPRESDGEREKRASKSVARQYREQKLGNVELNARTILIHEFPSAISRLENEATGWRMINVCD